MSNHDDGADDEDCADNADADDDEARMKMMTIMLMMVQVMVMMLMLMPPPMLPFSLVRVTLALIFCQKMKKMFFFFCLSVTMS